MVPILCASCVSEGIPRQLRPFQLVGNGSLLWGVRTIPPQLKLVRHLGLGCGAVAFLVPDNAIPLVEPVPVPRERRSDGRDGMRRRWQRWFEGAVIWTE